MSTNIQSLKTKILSQTHHKVVTIFRREVLCKHYGTTLSHQVAIMSHHLKESSPVPTAVLTSYHFYPKCLHQQWHAFNALVRIDRLPPREDYLRAELLQRSFEALQ